MAHITYQPPSPKAGTSEHVSRETANALIAAGFAVEIQPAPIPLKPVEYGVFKGALQNTPVALYCRCATCGRRDDYIGTPDAESIAVNFVSRLCAHAKNTVVPEHIRAAYEQEFTPSPLGWRSGVPGINAPSQFTTNNPIRYGVDENGKVRK